MYFQLPAERGMIMNTGVHSAGSLAREFYRTNKYSAVNFIAFIKPSKSLTFDVSAFCFVHFIALKHFSFFYVVVGWWAADGRWESQCGFMRGEWTWRTVAGTGSSGCVWGPGAGRECGASGNLLRLSSFMPVHTNSGTNQAISYLVCQS